MCAWIGAPNNIAWALEEQYSTAVSGQIGNMGIRNETAYMSTWQSLNYVIHGSHTQKWNHSKDSRLSFEQMYAKVWVWDYTAVCMQSKELELVVTGLSHH